MILTVTPNPAIDLTYQVPQILPGASHRVQPPLVRSGGKGINVARVLHHQGLAVRALATAGGDTGKQLAAGLAGIAHRLVPVAAATRRTIALVDAADGQTSIFNEVGAPLQAAEWLALASAVADELQGADLLVGSGSLPAGAPADFYPGLVALARQAGLPVLIDASGSGLLSAASAGADLLKPNRDELHEATGERDLSAGARVLMRLGARRVLVSNGAEGMLAFEAGRAGHLSARLAQPLTGNPTGAGDAAVAGAASLLVSGEDDLQLIVRRAAAWGSAAVLMPTAGEISPQWRQLELDLIVEELS